MSTQAHVVEVDVPAEQAYGWWRGLTNLPAVLPGVESVEMAESPQHTRWSVRDAAGSTVECQAKITEDIPNEKIAWHSPDAAAAGQPESGVVRFVDLGESTEVEVTLEYADRAAGGDDTAKSVVTAFKTAVESAPVLERHVERI